MFYEAFCRIFANATETFLKLKGGEKVAMNEILRLQKENDELRKKLQLAIDIVNEFIDTERKRELLEDLIETKPFKTLQTAKNVY